MRHDTEEMGSTLRGSRERDEEEHNGRARHVCSAKHASTIRLDDDAAPREGALEKNSRAKTVKHRSQKCGPCARGA